MTSIWVAATHPRADRTSAILSTRPGRSRASRHAALAIRTASAGRPATAPTAPRTIRPRRAGSRQARPKATTASAGSALGWLRALAGAGAAGAASRGRPARRAADLRDASRRSAPFGADRRDPARQRRCAPITAAPAVRASTNDTIRPIATSTPNERAIEHRREQRASRRRRAEASAGRPRAPGAASKRALELKRPRRLPARTARGMAAATPTENDPPSERQRRRA